MASEWTLVTRMEDPIDYVVADATGIEKGTLLKMTDSGTAIAHSAAGDMCAGVAAREKIANDGRTELAVFKRGRFIATSSGVITIGAPIKGGVKANTVIAATATDSGAAIIGTAEATGALNEPIQVFLNVGGGCNPI